MPGYSSSEYGGKLDVWSPRGSGNHRPLPIGSRITASGNTRVTIRHTRFGNISAVSKGDGEIAFNLAWAKAYRKLANKFSAHAEEIGNA